MNQIERNLYLLNQKIDKACKIYDKKRENINLVAVSKKFGSDKIIEAINANCKIFGENYVNEAEEKWPEIKKKFPEVKLHFIGGLQTNKVKKVLDLFDVVESLDSEKLAKEFQKEILKKKEKDENFKAPEFFVQVNIGQEPQKSGIEIDKVKEFVDFAKNECGLNVTGLMGIAPVSKSASPYFALLCKILRENSLENLSMGMSADFQEAIALNSNYIRIGSAIFGERI